MWKDYSGCGMYINFQFHNNRKNNLFLNNYYNSFLTVEEQ